MENCIKIQSKDVEIIRLKLKGWSQLEGIKKELDAAVSIHNYDKIFMCMVKFIETAVVSSHKIEWDEIPWYEFLEIYSRVIAENSPTIDFPILRGGKQDNKKLPWEYDGRSWYFWFNLFAKTYGWGEEAIANLDIDTAIGLYQEIAIDEQLDKEWQWGLSEIAYPYNRGTKKQEYKPLQRPQWMLPIVPKQLPVVRMHKAHLPMGNVIDLQAQAAEKTKKHGT